MQGVCQIELLGIHLSNKHLILKCQFLNAINELGLRAVNITGTADAQKQEFGRSQTHAFFQPDSVNLNWQKMIKVLIFKHNVKDNVINP
jgi:hypothetical protein